MKLIREAVLTMLQSRYYGRVVVDLVEFDCIMRDPMNGNTTANYQITYHLDGFGSENLIHTQVGLPLNY